ncbi:MAG: S41 family peptidase [Rubrivivax sp.]|nr:S41 family peptidase [Rubrivivax sp.]
MSLSTRLPRGVRKLQRLLALAAVPVLLAACGGGGTAETPLACTVAEQKQWLGDYMNEWYFWYRLAPRPDPAPYTDVDSYFNALLYTGTDANFPADRWSRRETDESFNRFFGDGATLGYGVSVAGLEVAGDGTLPLYVRHVEPASPAAAQGVQRGDQVISINGQLASVLVAANDFTALSAANAGDTLALVLRRNGSDRNVSLTAAVFLLTPVTNGAVLQSAGGRKLGYVVVKDMISQALAPLETAFSQFKAAGVSDVVLDLRYNGGGLVSTGATLASYIAGLRGSGLSFATLLYNDKRAAINNQSFMFSSLASSLGMPRAFVLMGRRTCSASEQVINGLRGAGIEVIAIGETTCGKPVGFLPASACGYTYSAVNFESVNQRNEGRYFDGFGATCPVAEDFTLPIGSMVEPLLAAAARYADGGGCPAASTRELPQSLRGAARRAVEPGERQGMLGR